MEIRIGVTHSPKEISLEIGDEPDALENKVTLALEAPATMLWLVDKKGKRVGIPCDKLAYIEMDPQTETRAVGFKP